VEISEDFEHHVRTLLVHFSVSSLAYFIVQLKSGEVEFLSTCPTGMPCHDLLQHKATEDAC
jgi:hypothetical protein